jgi:pimeloyl-ACP methyl ester carboxylesterase
VRLIQLLARKTKGGGGTVLEHDETSRRVFGAVRQCFKQGGEGYRDDERIFTKSRGFKLKDVPFEKVRLWHGTADGITPTRWSRHMAARFTNAVLEEYPGDTHFTICNRSEEVWKELLDIA